MRDRVEVLGQITLHNVRIAVLFEQPGYVPHCLHGAPAGPVAVRGGLEVRLEDRLDDQLSRRLHHPVPDRRDAERSLAGRPVRKCARPIAARTGWACRTSQSPTKRTPWGCLRRATSHPQNSCGKSVDVGTATGAGANLLATLYKGKFFGIQMKVDALETKNNNKFEPYPKLHFPDINYIVSNLFELNKNLLWDLVICSHTVEHMIDPFPFIEELQRRSKHWVLIYCPLNEQPLIKPHKFIFTKDIIDSLQPLMVEIIDSPAWSNPEGTRKCVLFVLKGKADSNFNI